MSQETKASNGAALRAVETTTMLQIQRNAMRLRGAKAEEFSLMSVKLGCDTTRKLNLLARRIAKRTGARFWQVKAAMMAAVFSKAFGPGARSL